jgi:hypothetical protein
MGPLRKVQVIGSWRSEDKSKDKDTQTIIIWLCVWCELSQLKGSEEVGGGCICVCVTMGLIYLGYRTVLQ